MDNRALEGLEPQKIQEPAVAETSQLPPAPVGLTEAEIADLKHKAEVSSQNFERAKKAELALKEKEEELERINQSIQTDFSDEGRALQSEIKTIKESLAKRDVLDANPILKDKWKEFEDFRADPDNKGMNMKTAAKAFLTESGLLEVPRQGLESKTGGDRIPFSTGMTIEEAEKLRVTNSRGYADALAKGLIPNS